MTASATTANPDYASYYAAYESGAELEIGGLVVSKAVFGKATLLTEETKTITADGVYFVPDGVTATYASGTRNTLIVIGDNPSGRGEFTITTTRITFNPTNRGHFVLFNLHFGLSTANGEGQILFYPNSTAGGMMQTVAMEDCDLDLTGFQGFSFTASRTADTPIGIENVSFVDCDINVGPSIRFGYFFQYREHGSIGNAVFRNNVIWSGNAANATRIFNLSMGQSEAQYAVAAPVGSLEFERNTWINCKPSVINIVKNVGRLVIRNNLFYGTITQHTPFITYEAGCVPSSGEIADNLGLQYERDGYSLLEGRQQQFSVSGFQRILHDQGESFRRRSVRYGDGCFRSGCGLRLLRRPAVKCMNQKLCKDETNLFNDPVRRGSGGAGGVCGHRRTPVRCRRPQIEGDGTRKSRWIFLTGISRHCNFLQVLRPSIP